MLPIKDENPHPPGFKPKLTYALIAINVIIFLFEVAITGTGISDWENFAIGQTMFEIGKSGEVFTSSPTPITQSSIP